MQWQQAGNQCRGHCDDFGSAVNMEYGYWKTDNFPEMYLMKDFQRW